MMRTIHERGEARWLPSRHRHALFRLYAFLRLRFAKQRVESGLLLTIDRDQSEMENYVISVWFTLTLSLFMAGTWFDAWPVLIAVLVAIPIATALSQTVMISLALVAAPLWAAITRRGDRIRPVSIGTMGVVVVPAILLRDASGWVRFVAWHVLILLGLNVLARVLVFSLRAPIAKAEAAYEISGGPPSAS